MKSIYDFDATTIEGRPKSLSDFRGKVVLIVNTASKCGFTPQYEGLEALHESYADRGLAVLGFPCNQFGSQEPAAESEIAEFCTLNFGVRFPMFAKIEVNGPRTHPLYRFLKAEKRGLLGIGRIKWNFTKFLVDRSGAVVGRFGPATKPDALRQSIEKLL